MQRIDNDAASNDIAVLCNPRPAWQGMRRNGRDVEKWQSDKVRHKREARQNDASWFDRELGGRNGHSASAEFSGRAKIAGKYCRSSLSCWPGAPN